MLGMSGLCCGHGSVCNLPVVEDALAYGEPVYASGNLGDPRDRPALKVRGVTRLAFASGAEAWVGVLDRRS